MELYGVRTIVARYPERGEGERRRVKEKERKRIDELKQKFLLIRFSKALL